MGRFGIIDELVDSTKANSLYDSITLGEVMNSNDPQQMGRLQVFVPALDRQKDQPLPWAYYGSPFGGLSDADNRGPAEQGSNGPVAYGMWAIPKVGATVMIMCLDNNPDMRVWLGCIHGMQFPHTMPHGRYVDKDGPLTSTEGQIEPLYTAQTAAFNGPASQVEPRESHEYLTRGADRPLSANSIEAVGTYADYSKKPDDTDEQGYGSDQNVEKETDHSNIYSFTTPGFHSWSMDDNPGSCRMRFRSTSGNQIILDDTNERLYISTAQGKTWIEMDEKGTLDIYSEQDLSIRSQQDINIVSDKTVRIAGKEGVHITSQADVRIYADGIQMKAEGDVRTTADNIFSTAATDIHTNAEGNIRIKGATLFLEAEANINILGSSVQVGGNLNVAGPVGVTGTLNAVGPIASGADVTTPTHSLNLHTHTYVLPKIPAIPAAQPGITLPQLFPTGVAGIAEAAPEPSESEPAESATAFFPSRAPQHEPFARVYLDLAQTDTDELSLDLFDSIINDPDSVSEHVYTAADVGKGSAARGRVFTRNTKWRR